MVPEVVAEVMMPEVMMVVTMTPPHLLDRVRALSGGFEPAETIARRGGLRRGGCEP